jgi:hypothetical protein
MMKRPWASAIGLVVYLCITLWMQRTGGSRVLAGDLLGSCLVAVVSVGLGWFAAALLTKDIHRRGLIALVVGLWGLLFSSFQVLAATALGSSFQSPLFAVVIWTALCMVACLIISRGSAPLTFATKALGIATIILLAMQLVQAAPVVLRAQAAEAATRDTARRTTSPNAAAKEVDRRDGRRPDVFLIVLDKYSSGAWLSHTYGLNHKPFEDSLRALGFVVPTAARANYAHTQIALASFLNWRLIDTSAARFTLTWNAMRALIDTARVWEAFKSNGYRVVAIPTTFPATRTLARADVELRPKYQQPSVPFAETWRVNSPLSSLPARKKNAPMPYPAETITEIEWKLGMLESLPDSAGPVFAFMHLLSPHEPYLFNSDCSPREPWWPLTDQGDDFERIRAAYAVQVVCLDRMLLRTVRSLLRRPGVRPVIILQADHGHGQISVDPLRGFTLTEKELSRERLGERFGVFAGYLFPGADTAVYEDISAVNVMPLVLRSLFGTTARRQPDRSFWSSYQDAFQFSEVPPVLTRPPHARSAAQTR